MPGFDGTGPRGMGSMTGRGLGYCIVPVRDNVGYSNASMPYAGNYLEPQGYFGPLSESISTSGGLRRISFPFQGGRGRRSWSGGRFFHMRRR